MNELPPVSPRPDTTGWPVVAGQPADEFLGSFEYDCWSNLTADQKSWPVVAGEPADVWLGSYDETGRRLDRPRAVVSFDLPDGSARAELDATLAEFVRSLEAKGLRPVSRTT